MTIQVPSPHSLPPRASPVREIIVVIKTHFDIGYTHRVKDLIPYYRTEMIDKAMAVMDASGMMPPEQRFVWNTPGWVLSKALEDWPGQTPERRRKLDAYVKSGKFCFHALPFTLESDACELEELVRSFSFASRLSRRYEIPLPRSGKMTDVPSHGGALASVLANGGVKFMHLGCNWPSGYVRTPGIFWWEGPDGSRVLMLYSSIYGTCTGLWPAKWRSTSDCHFANEPFIGRNLLPPGNWPYEVWPAIIVTPDNSGPPDPKIVKELFEEVTHQMPGVAVRFGTLDDFADAFLAQNPDLPVVKGEMPDAWIHGIMCDPAGMKISRDIHPLIASAEALHTQLGFWDRPQPAIADKVAAAYEGILLFGEHTWGGSTAIGQYGEAFRQLDPKSYADLEGSWEDKTDYIRDAAEIVRTLSDDALRSLAAAVRHDGPALLVYNPLPWARSGIVEADGRLLVAEDVPPCGYKTYPVDQAHGPDRCDASTTIESSFFRLTLDPTRGAISSLVDKRTGREWVDPAAEHGLGQYLNERFTYEQTRDYTVAYQAGRAFGTFGAAGEWPHFGMHKPGMISGKQVPYRAAGSAKGTVKTTRSGVLQTATMTCPADYANRLPETQLRVTLPHGLPYLELQITIVEKAKDNWPEADWLCLPFKVATPTFRVYRQLGVMDPTTDILPGANRHLYTVGHGVTISGADGLGIAVCPMDHPLLSLDRPGAWKFSMDFVPAKPVIYLNLYNNQWNTNFRYWYPGTWSSRVRLWTFDAATPVDQIIATPAIEARSPLTAVALAGSGAGAFPVERSGLTFSRRGVLLTAFGQNPDGDGTVLRVWEQAGVHGDLTVTLPGDCLGATPVNLRGERLGAPIPVKDRQLTFPLRAYAPASFILLQATVGSSSPGVGPTAGCVGRLTGCEEACADTPRR